MEHLLDAVNYEKVMPELFDAPKGAMTFGSLLRDIRRQKRVTQRQLASVVGVDFTYISKIENGSMPAPSEKVIEAFIRCLGAEVHRYALYKLAMVVPSDLRQILRDSQYAVDLIRAIRDLDDDAVKHLVVTAEFLKQRN